MMGFAVYLIGYPRPGDPVMPKTWQQKLNGGKAPHIVELQSDFTGIPPGARLFIASPRLIDETIAAIPRGQVKDPIALRAELAAAHGADATCPVSTAIFLRVVAEAALERLATGASPTDITPFWRVIAPGSKIAKKLTCDDRFLSLQRELEAATLG
jgi:hypothetical protein